MKRKADDEAALFDALMLKHGVTADDLAGAAIVRALAKALAADDLDPPMVAGLASLLAAERKPRDELDLSRLSERHIDELERIIRIGRGEAPPSAAGHKPRSTVLRECLRLVPIFDKIAIRVASGAAPGPEAVGHEERVALRSQLNVLLSLCGLRVTLDHALSLAPAVALDRAPLPAPLPETSSPLPTPPPAPQNVVPIRQPRNGLASVIDSGALPPHLDANKSDWPAY
jgi:hypothetical protein